MSLGWLAGFSRTLALLIGKQWKEYFRYLKGTTDYMLCYQASDLHLIGYSDADWGSDLDQRKSTSGYAFLLNNGAIS